MPSQIRNLKRSKYFKNKKLVVALSGVLFLGIGSFVVGYFLSRDPYVAIPPVAPYVPYELLVNYREDKAPHELSDSQRQDLEIRLKAFGVESQEKAYESMEGLLSRYYLLKLEEGKDIGVLQEELSHINEILASEPNFIMEPFRIPNDPQYSSLWGLEKIQAPVAWDTTIGSSAITVAVIDSGIDLSHPDLSGRLTSGYDFYSNDSDPSDECGHGTHVAGTVGAVGDNDVGVVGVNWDVRIMPVKTMGPAYGRCGGTTQSIVSGIEYAITNGARVINMSLGGGGSCAPQSSYQNAINEGISKGVVVVVAAGNSNTDAVGFTPASCQGVISVGASTQNDGKASFSNYGDTVDISAPGVNILSTIPGASYKVMQGTSMAAPHVAGAAALLLSVNSGLTSAEVESCLVSNADGTSSSSSIGPRLNIANAIANCGRSGSITIPTLTPDPQVTLTPGVAQYYIQGIIYEDTNNSGSFDAGDSPMENQIVELSGAYSDTTATLTDGTFIFDSLFPGTFRIGYQGISTEDLILDQNSPSIQVPIRVTRDIAQPTVTVVIQPTSGPLPTNDPIQPPTEAAKKPTATPTPIKYYRCDFDPSCNQGEGSIQLCPLICTSQ